MSNNSLLELTDLALLKHGLRRLRNVETGKFFYLNLKHFPDYTQEQYERDFKHKVIKEPN